MLVTINDIAATEMYPEIINKIIRGNTAEAELQIATAEDIVKSYLIKFDIQAIFGTSTAEPTFNSLSIKQAIKTIASWFLVKKSNPNIQIELFYDSYKETIKWLEKIQEGKLNPGLPYKEEAEGDENGTGVYYESLPKQINFF